MVILTRLMNFMERLTHHMARPIAIVRFPMDIIRRPMTKWGRIAAGAARGRPGLRNTCHPACPATLDFDLQSFGMLTMLPRSTCNLCVARHRHHSGCPEEVMKEDSHKPSEMET